MEYQDQVKATVKVKVKIEVRLGLESILRIVTRLFVSIEDRSESTILFPATLIYHMETSSRDYIVDL